MIFDDKTIQCVDCKTNFTFTAGEQEFYQTKGFTNEPKRCRTCRDKRKSQGGGGRRSSAGGEGPRPAKESFDAVCAACGAHTTVPFKPTQGRPVYCRDCYRSKR